MSETEDWSERSRNIKCEDCDETRRAVLRMPGTEWIGCEPISGEPGRCLATWRVRR